MPCLKLQCWWRPLLAARVQTTATSPRSPSTLTYPNPYLFFKPRRVCYGTYVKVLGVLGSTAALFPRGLWKIPCTLRTHTQNRHGKPTACMGLPLMQPSPPPPASLLLTRVYSRQPMAPSVYSLTVVYLYKYIWAWGW